MRDDFYDPFAYSIRELELDQLEYALGTLADNLTTAAGLERAYSLGRAACTCDQEQIGYEWSSGMGVSPEDIDDRRWNHNGHVFTPMRSCAGVCADCGHHADDWRHDPEYIEQCGGIPSSHFFTTPSEEDLVLLYGPKVGTP